MLASVLVASKMRERDIECPTVPVISKAGSRLASPELMSTVSEIKNAEILINNKFQWNFAIRTPYDYLETFLAIGVLLESDCLTEVSQRVSPMSDFRAPECEPQYSKDGIAPLDRLGMSPKERGEDLSYGKSKYHSTPSTNLGPVMVASFSSEMKTELRRKVRDTCLEVAEYLSATSICNPDLHKNLAYAIVAFSRKQHKIQEFE